MWGAEMGANEYGVVIGNEAVFTKLKFEKHNNGLTGMDMLRLALERSKTAKNAVECIISLLELYGQNACGGYKNKRFYYHNSFLIADTQEAWVLETAGTHWATEKIKDVRSISNRLSIGPYAEQHSSSVQSFAKDKKWWKDNTPFTFHAAYSDWLYTKLGRAAQRQSCTLEAAKKLKGTLTSNKCFRILKTHNLPEEKFKPSRANTASVCMHATSILNPSDTTGSMVAEMRYSGIHTIWLTGTPHPCLSVYVPFFFGTSTLDDFIQPTEKSDNSLWWQAHDLHRWISKDYQQRKNLLTEQLNLLQNSFCNREKELIANNPTKAELENFSYQCLRDYWNMVQELSAKVLHT
jgi:dipeptidase